MAVELEKLKSVEELDWSARISENILNRLS